MDWQEISGNWVLIPPRPTAIVHFLGGAFVATAPQVTYRWLLENLAHHGYAVIATPFVNTLDHAVMARQALNTFEQALEYLQGTAFKKYLPIYGVGHSMGCKLHVLICAVFEQERAGNILISFNNFPAKRSIPFLEQFSQASSMVDTMRQSFPMVAEFTDQFIKVSPTRDVEFVPSPDETNRIIANEYNVSRNLLIKFRKDDIDQTQSLADIMQQRFPELTTLRILNGNHLTPLGQDINWQAGETFSPVDAIAQAVKQNVYQDLNDLKRNLLMWLNPLASV
ncbi:MAG: DUF1350 family protein [Elainellaceae cyanobacterium]